MLSLEQPPFSEGLDRFRVGVRCCSLRLQGPSSRSESEMVRDAREPCRTVEITRVFYYLAREGEKGFLQNYNDFSETATINTSVPKLVD